jgi:aminoglycoside/choline kinase family phosphotransferase
MTRLPEEKELLSFASIVTGSPVSIHRLTGTGIERIYWRVSGKLGTAIILFDPDLEEDDSFFMKRNLFERYGFPVPSLYEVDFQEKLLLIQDLGTVSLHEFVRDNREEMVLQRYREAIDLMARMQHIESPGESLISIINISDELQYVREHFLMDICRAEPHSREVKLFDELASILSEKLSIPEKNILCHRNFHSRNLYLFNGRVVMKGFRHTVMGHPWYDAASLLGDPYTHLQENMYNELLQYVQEKLSSENLSEYYTLLLLRMLQVIGFYAVRGRKPGREYSLQWIVPAMARVEESWIHLPQYQSYLSPFLQRAREILL